jgi:ornithine cyclodeaminase/alanine dehydrogenase
MAADPGILFLDSEATRPLLDWENVIRALREAYAAPMGPAQAPPRVVARGNGAWLRALAAVCPTGRYMGAKLFGLSRSKGVNYVIVLFDQQSGAIAAFVDAKELTAARTAATSAIAVDRITPHGPVSIGLLGSGAEAQAHARAVAAVRPVASIRLYSPTSARREAAAAQLAAELKTRVAAVASPELAVKEANLVIAAARSHDETPILKGDWLAPGMTVVSIGSTLPEQREVDSEVVRRSVRIVADVPEEVAHETGDMLQAARDGVPFADKLVSLADVVSGRLPGRSSPGEIVMFKSVGSALQDIAVAEMCLLIARERGLGKAVSMEFSLKQV